MAKKITPEIEKYIAANRALSGGALKDLIAKKFKIVVTSRSVELYLAKARAEAESDNAAKVEAVRSKILDDADKWANKYLQYTDDEIESLRKLIKASEEGEHPVALETARDRLAASTALHKMLSTIIDFVKPEEKANVTVNIKPDLSKLSTDELRQLRSIKSKLEGDRSGAGQAESS
ncbi:MAG: hypothetical protein WC119_10900 [Synergistaceae bacterium]|jgi:hypothetical protein